MQLIVSAAFDGQVCLRAVFELMDGSVVFPAEGESFVFTVSKKTERH